MRITIADNKKIAGKTQQLNKNEEKQVGRKIRKQCEKRMNDKNSNQKQNPGKTKFAGAETKFELANFR